MRPKKYLVFPAFFLLGPINPDGSYQDEWLCEHGVGHPKDPETHHGDGIHGCDGCCGKEETTNKT